MSTAASADLWAPALRRRTRRTVLPVVAAILAVIAGCTAALAADHLSRHESAARAQRPVSSPTTLTYPSTTAASTATTTPASPSTSAPASTAPSTSAAHSTAPAGSEVSTQLIAHPGTPTPAGGELAAASIPWSSVGAGWTVVAWTRITADPDSEMLYLVSPSGQHYQLRYFANSTPRPELWSPDGTRLLLDDGTNDGSGYEQLTLATGAVHAVPLPSGSFVVSYTRPTGTALLVADSDWTTLTRVKTSGVVEGTYPTSAAGLGAVAAVPSAYSPDGALLAVGAAHGVAIFNNDGTLHQAIVLSMLCSPDEWLSDTTLELHCITNAQTSDTEVFDLTLGHQPVQVTDGASAGNQFGVDEVWSTSAGRFGWAPNGCGPDSLVRVDAAGHATRIDVPLPAGIGGVVAPSGHAGDEVYLVAIQTHCQSPTATLFAYDTATGTSTALFTAAGGGTVAEALTWSERD